MKLVDFLRGNIYMSEKYLCDGDGYRSTQVNHLFD